MRDSGRRGRSWRVAPNKSRRFSLAVDSRFTDDRFWVGVVVVLVLSGVGWCDMVIWVSKTAVGKHIHESNSLEYPLNGTIGLNTIQSWWGNTVFTRTGDWNSVSLKTVAPGQTFGCVVFRLYS